MSGIQLLKTALLTTLLLTLVACGGGGGDGLGGGSSSDPGTTPTTPPPPPAPIYGIGNGAGTTYVDGAINASQTTLRAGESATLRVNVVITNQNNDPPTANQTVAFTSTCVSTGRAVFGTVTAISPGLYSVLYTNNGCDGDDNVTATLTATNSDTATIKLTMIGPDVLTVSFVSSTHDQLSLAGIGGNESTELTFKVAGPQGVPIIGKQVSFSINTSVGGASILAGRTTGITDQDGLARTVLNSGTVAGPVSVLAVHQESGKQGSSSDIIISTGVPVASRFSVSYQPFNPVGAFENDGVTVAISIIASDVFGNNPTDGTRVSFVAPESGNVQNSCELQDGACSVLWRSTSPRPTNMRIEVIAYTDGAENFIDNNGNSLFDAADGTIADMGEPYADENESGTYNVGEFFFDTNRNGVRDTGNSKWDGPCLNKVNPAAVCTGNSTVTIYDTVTIVMPTNIMRLLNLGTFPAAGTNINITQGGRLDFSGLVIADSNGTADVLGSNPPPFGTSITFSIQGGGVSLQGLTSFTVPNALYAVGPFAATIVSPLFTSTPPTNVSLLLTIQVPGRATQQFSWPVTIL